MKSPSKGSYPRVLSPLFKDTQELESEMEALIDLEKDKQKERFICVLIWSVITKNVFYLFKTYL